jgi:hypothetical protein
VSVSLSICALVDGRDRAYFGRRGQDTDQTGFIDARTQAIFGRSYAAELDVLIQQLKEDEMPSVITSPIRLGLAAGPFPPPWTQARTQAGSTAHRIASPRPSSGRPLSARQATIQTACPQRADLWSGM